MSENGTTEDGSIANFYRISREIAAGFNAALQGAFYKKEGNDMVKIKRVEIGWGEGAIVFEVGRCYPIYRMKENADFIVDHIFDRSICQPNNIQIHIDVYDDQGKKQVGIFQQAVTIYYEGG